MALMFRLNLIIGWGEWGHGALEGAGVLLRSLVRSLHARPAPLAVVAGHDPAASGRLFSLFAHLAGAAQLARPREGGVVLDDAWEHLPAMLGLGGSGPEYPAAYRMRFRQGVPGPGDRQPDAITRCPLHLRSDQV